MSRDCCVAITLSAMGLSAVCDCDTHYFWVSFMRTAMAFATFAWSSLSLRHNLKFSCGDSNGDLMPFVRAARIWPVCAFAQAYLSLRHCTKSLVLP